MTDETLQTITDAASQWMDLLPQLAGAAAVFLVFAVGGWLLARGATRALGRAQVSGHALNWLRRVLRWGSILLGLVLALQIMGWTGAATSLLATGGIAAVVFGFAFREIGENLLAGMFLAFSRSFNVGDVIESGGHRGTIRAIELRHVHIRSVDGCDIFIPSAEIYKNPLLNFTRDGLRRFQFDIGIDYADDLDLARSLLLKTLQQTTGVLAAPKALVAIQEFVAAYAVLRCYAWVDVDQTPPDMVQVRSDAMNNCRRALLDAGYTLSSDTVTRLAVNMGDGAPGQ